MFNLFYPCWVREGSLFLLIKMISSFSMGHQSQGDMSLDRELNTLLVKKFRYSKTMDWAMVKVKVRFRDKKRDIVSRYKAIVKFVFLLKEYPFCFYVLNFSTFLKVRVFLKNFFWEGQENQNSFWKFRSILGEK